MDFAGGWVFPLQKGGHVASANITPDRDTGIGSWTKDEFVAKVQGVRRSRSDHARQSRRREHNHAVDDVRAGMTAEDLAAVYDYLRTQKPVSESSRSVPALTRARSTMSS